MQMTPINIQVKGQAYSPYVGERNEVFDKHIL